MPNEKTKLHLLIVKPENEDESLSTKIKSLSPDDEINCKKCSNFNMEDITNRIDIRHEKQTNKPPRYIKKIEPKNAQTQFSQFFKLKCRFHLLLNFIQHRLRRSSIIFEGGNL